MIKILLISENQTEITRFQNIFKKNSYSFEVMSDESLITDFISVDTPDIIIIDSQAPNIKNINKKIKSICENTIVIFSLATNNIEKDLIYV